MRKGVLNVSRFLDRAIQDNMLVTPFERVVKAVEDKKFDLDRVEKFYSPLKKDMCYNFDGFAVYGNEIDII